MKKAKDCEHEWRYVGRTSAWQPRMAKAERRKMYKSLFGKDAKRRMEEDRKRKPIVSFRCSKCGQQAERPMTKREVESFGANDRISHKTGIHDLIHEFQGKFQRRGREIFNDVLRLAKKTGVPYNHEYCPCILSPVNERFVRRAKRVLSKDKSLEMHVFSGTAVITSKGDFPKQGYDLLETLSKWARNKKVVLDVPCDDAWFSGSSIYLIPHEDEHDFMGTTLLAVPQHSGPPAEMFLYPCHAKALLDALRKVVASARKRRPKPPGKKREIVPKYSG